MKKLLLFILTTALAACCIIAGCVTDVKVQSVKINGDGSITVNTGETANFTAEVLPEDAANKNVIWSIEAGATATEAAVSHTGVFSAGYVGGACVVKAASEENPSIYATVNVTVNEVKQPTPATSVKIAKPANEYVVYGGTVDFTAEVLPEDADNKEVEWSLTDTASTGSAIGQDGKFTAGNASGAVTVVAKSAQNPEISDSCQLTVVPKLTDVSLGGNAEIEIGGTHTFTAQCTPAQADAALFDWQVTETNLKAGDYTLVNGLFTSVSGAGYAVVSATYKADPQITAQAVVNVNYDIAKKYTVTFKDESGNVLSVQKVEQNGSALPPEYVVLGKEVSWNGDYQNVTSDRDITAVLTDIEYTVTYYKPGEDGNWVAIQVEGSTVQTVTYGGSAKAPAEEDYAIEGKLFVGWRIEKQGNNFSLYAEYIG